MKEKTTITLPARVDTGGAAFEDLLAGSGRGVHTDGRRKNAAFSFLVDRGLYLEFREYLPGQEIAKGEITVNQ